MGFNLPKEFSNIEPVRLNGRCGSGIYVKAVKGMGTVTMCPGRSGIQTLGFDKEADPEKAAKDMCESCKKKKGKALTNEEHLKNFLKL